jgi:hypothetical protein
MQEKKQKKEPRQNALHTHQSAMPLLVAGCLAKHMHYMQYRGVEGCGARTGPHCPKSHPVRHSPRMSLPVSLKESQHSHCANV